MDYMDYGGQAIGWIIVLFYIFPVSLIYPVLLILSFLFKWPKLRKVITIISFPVLPLFIYYPISSLTTRLFLWIFPDLFNSQSSDVFIHPTILDTIFSVLTIGFIIYLIRLHKQQEQIKFEKTLRLYGVLFIVFIVVVVVNAFITKNIYAQNHSTYLPFIHSFMHTV